MSDVQNEIMKIMEESSKRGKKRMSSKDLAKKMGLSQMKLKKETRGLIDSAVLAYWTSGSTTYLMLQKDVDVLKQREGTV